MIVALYLIVALVTALVVAVGLYEDADDPVDRASTVIAGLFIGVLWPLLAVVGLMMVLVAD